MDLNQLAQRISDQLKTDGYRVQSASQPVGIIIQAQKAGILRDVITAERAFTILVTGQPNDFSVHVGIGKWIQNIAVAAAELFLLSALFLAVDIPEMLWDVHVEHNIVKKIQNLVG
jgi:hypothetical protein